MVIGLKSIRYLDVEVSQNSVSWWPEGLQQLDHLRINKECTKIFQIQVEDQWIEYDHGSK